MPIFSGVSGPVYSKNFEIRDVRIVDLDKSYGRVLSDSITFSNGLKGKVVSLNQPNFTIQLDIYDPDLQQVVSLNSLSNTDFSGINLEVQGGALRESMFRTLDSKATRRSISLSDLAINCAEYTGVENLSSLRTGLYLYFTSKSVFGDVSNFSLDLRIPEPEIFDLNIITKNPLRFNVVGGGPGLQNISLFCVKDNSIEDYSGNKNLLLSDNNSYVYYRKDFDLRNKDIESYVFEANVPVIRNDYQDISLPFNLVLVPQDNFSTGSYFLSSGIKSYFNSEYDIAPEINNLTGKVIASQNKYDKYLDLQAFVKWDETKNKNLTFEADIVEFGETGLAGHPQNQVNYQMTAQNPSVENISYIVQGTGSGINVSLINSENIGVYSSDIFYVTGSGIGWQDHTLFLDDYNIFEPGEYNTGTSLSYITEVRIPSGSLQSTEIYFVYSFDTGTSEYSFYPSGGQYTGSIYTGTYYGYPFTGLSGEFDSLTGLNSGISGVGVPSSLTDLDEHGVLIAKIITGYNDGSLVRTDTFLQTAFDPSLSFPVKPNKNYKFK